MDERSSEIHRLVGLSLVICAVGLFMAGVQLLTTCKTTVNTSVLPNTLSCVYPFQVDAFAFIYVAILFAITAGNVFAHSPVVGAADRKTTFDRGAASLLAAVIVGAALAYAASALHLG